TASFSASSRAARRPRASSVASSVTSRTTARAPVIRPPPLRAGGATNATTQRLPSSPTAPSAPSTPPPVGKAAAPGAGAVAPPPALDGGGRKRHLEAGPVLADHGLGGLDALAPGHRGEDAGEGRGGLRGGEYRHRLPDEFVGVVAEQRLGAGAPADNRPVQRHQEGDLLVRCQRSVSLPAVPPRWRCPSTIVRPRVPAAGRMGLWRTSLPASGSACPTTSAST